MVDWSGRVYPEGVPGTDADQVSFFRGGRGRASVRFKLWTLDPLGLRLQTPFRLEALPVFYPHF